MEKEWILINFVPKLDILIEICIELLFFKIIFSSDMNSFHLPIIYFPLSRNICNYIMIYYGNSDSKLMLIFCDPALKFIILSSTTLDFLGNNPYSGFCHFGENFLRNYARLLIHFERKNYVYKNMVSWLIIYLLRNASIVCSTGITGCLYPSGINILIMAWYINNYKYYYYIRIFISARWCLKYKII